LADLTHHNNLNGTVKSEAHDLAKLLKDALGEGTLVPRPPAKAREPKAAASSAPAAPSAKKASNSNDPFREFK
jgi:hypothetical protein